MNPMEWYGVEAMQKFFLEEMERLNAELGAEITSALEGVEQQLSDLTVKVDELQAAVQGVSERVSAALQTALDNLAAERQQAAELAAAEEAEDVSQNAALQEAQAATDAALADAQQAVSEIGDAVTDLNAIAPAETPTEPEPEQPPVEEPPVEPTPEEPQPQP